MSTKPDHTNLSSARKLVSFIGILRYVSNCSGNKASSMIMMAAFVLSTFTISLYGLVGVEEASAQGAHGATVGKSCVSPKHVGNTMDCDATLTHADSFGDTVRINVAFDEVCQDPPACTILTRIPAVGNLPVLLVSGNAFCTAGTFPCFVGPPGSTLSGLPGVGTVGSIIVKQNQYVIESDDSNPLFDQITFVTRDLCDAPGTMGCFSDRDNILQAPASTILTEDCILVDPPDDAISMNSIINKNIVKTVHAEKQIFECILEQGNISVIEDVTIIAEIYEDMSTKSIIKKQVEVITCTKNPSTVAVIKCRVSIPSTDTVVVRHCLEQTIEHPQEMNTVNKGPIVKTIVAQKEVFLCDLDGFIPEFPQTFDPEKKIDVVLFTELWEDLRLLPSDPTLPPIIESLRCVLNILDAEVESCQFTKVKS